MCGFMNPMFRRIQFRILRQFNVFYPHQRQFSNGSFLIEAILSIVILSTSITLVIQAMTSSLRAGIYSRDYTYAALLSENKMVEFLEKGFISRGLREEGLFKEPYSQFKYVLETDSLPSAKNINTVKLHVKWQAGRKENTVSILTYLFNQPSE